MAAKPETQDFHPGSYTLDYISRNLALPQVVRCDHSSHDTRGEEEDGGVGYNTALLLHSSRDHPRAVGVLLAEAGPDRKLKEIGENVTIPIDYDGWFEVFQSKPLAKHVPLYRNMSSLIEAGCDVFLIGGKRTLQVTQEEDGAMKTALLKPGTVLKTIAITADQRYVKCTDSILNTLFLDVDTRGVFYMISRRNKKAMKVRVMQMKHILSDPKLKMPCLVKLIQGGRPFEHTTTEGWIKLTNIERFPSFIAATVSLRENGMVELPRQHPVKYKLATMNKGWGEFAGYKDAKRLCDKFAGVYSRSIKSSKLEVLYESDLDGRSKGRGILERTVSIGYQPLIQKMKHFPQRTAMNETMFKSKCQGDARDTSTHVGNHTHKPLLRRASDTYLTPVNIRSPSVRKQSLDSRWRSDDDVGSMPGSSVYANQICIDEASSANQKSLQKSAAPSPGRGSSSYVNVTIDANEDSLSNLSFSDEWGDDDNDYVNVDDMGFDDSDRCATDTDYIEMWNFTQKRVNQGQGQGQRSSVCDSGVFSIASSDSGHDL